MKAGRARIALAVWFTAAAFAACGRADPVGLSVAVATPPAAQATVTRAAATPTTVAAVAASAPTLRASRHRTARRSPLANGRITVSSIGLDVETFEGVDDFTLRYGPGHWEATARPGEVGNTTFAGHRTTFTRPFLDIDRLRAGDDVIFTTAAGVFTYRVTDYYVVGDTDTWIAEPTDTPTFTLFACHPKGSERQRYVVKGELVRADRSTSAPTPASPPPDPAPRQPACLLCIMPA